MNWLDILLAVILLLSFASSFRKGFSREIIGLVFSVVALLAGIWFYGTAGSFLLPYVSSPGVAHFCGFILVFFGVLLVGSLLSFAFSKVVKAVGLSWLDRLLGGAFGLVRGLVISIAILTAIMAFAPGVRPGSPPNSIVTSRVAPYVIDAAHVLTAVAPKELKDEFAARYEQVKKIWQDAWQG
ncbi:MAG: CvpA family protein [Bryobacteraceae bacterium]